MRIYNPTYKKVRINWDSVELPVNQGSPISAAGVVANTSDAIGLLPVYIYKKPIDEEVYILIGGDVYQSEVEAEFGAELTDDAIASMGGINFYEADGTIDKASGGGGESQLFEVQRVLIEDEAPRLNKTWKELDDAIKAGKIPYFIYIDSEDGFSVSSVYYCYSCTKNENNIPIGREVLFVSGAMEDGGLEPYPMLFVADAEDGYPYQD